MDEAEKWQKRFERERRARKEAEEILEQKSKELYLVNEELRGTLDNLEKMVTERTHELRIAVQEAEKANRAKSAFLANMSHEIRTPMNAMIGLTELCINKTQPSPKQRQYLNKIHQSAISLLGIINDILDFSKIEAGEMKMKDIPFTLGQVFQNLTNLVTEKVRKKNLDFIIERSPNLPDHFIGDPGRLGQVLLNLTYNAIKFTDDGYVKLAIRSITETDQTTVLEFSVTDTGIGMAEDHLNLLFKPFSQIDDTDTRKYEGTGLGLAIAKDFVNRMNGAIEVESNLGQGSTFRFQIQLTKNPHSNEINAKLPKLLANKQTLLIDDSPVTQQGICNYLNGCGLSVRTFLSDEKGAIEQACQEREFDLILINIHELDASLNNWLKSIKQRLFYDRDVKIILISNDDPDLIEEDIQNLNINSFIQKPIDPSFLFDTILESFGNEVLKEKVAPYHLEKESPDIRNIQGARLLLVEDNKINQQVAKELLEHAKFYVDVAANGQEALDRLNQDGPYDCVLMDIQMPVMGGYEATKLIRAQRRFQQLPIVAMTANALVSDKQAAIETGMNEHVAKPINTKLLFSVLLDVIEHKERPLPDFSKIEAHKLTTPDIAGLNSQSGVQNLHGDVKTYNELIKTFCFVGHGIFQDITVALGDDHHEAAMGSLHTLKGLATTIGAEPIQVIIARLETALCQQDTADIHVVKAELKSHLDDLIDAIETYFQESRRSLSIASPASNHKIREELLILKDMLEDYDVQAEQQLETLLISGLNKKMHAVLTKIGELINSYDFDEAHDLLSREIEKFDQLCEGESFDASH